jgi:hypothetical protein
MSSSGIRCEHQGKGSKRMLRIEADQTDQTAVEKENKNKGTVQEVSQ